MRDKSLIQVLFILSPSIVLVALGMDIIIPCIPIISADFNSDFALTQWVLSAYFLGTGIGQLVIGPFADHFGRCKTILISIALFIMSSLACSFAMEIYQLILARLFQGIGACGALVVVLAIIRDIYEGHTMPKAYSYINGVTALAPILAPIIGGLLLVWTGSWRSCFYFVSLFGVIAFAVNYFFLKESLSPIYVIEYSSLRRIINNYMQVVKNQQFLCYSICAISGLTSLLLFFSISPIIMIKGLDIKPNIYSLYFATNFMIYLIGNVVSPLIEKRININKLIFAGSCILFLGACLMLLWSLKYPINITGLMLPALIMSFGIGLMYGPCMAGAMSNFKHIAGTASAAYGALLYIISGLLVGVVMQHQVYNTFTYALVVIAMSVLNMLQILILSRKV